jgi:uncharacterized protein (TIGR02271 family)
MGLVIEQRARSKEHNMTNTFDDYNTWIGRPAVDRTGDKIGKVSQVYVDDVSGRPEWLAINTGLFKSHSSFVPLQGATSDGDQLMVAYDKAMVKDAPQVDDDGNGLIDPTVEQQLYEYYGGGAGVETAAATGGRDLSGPETDDAMTRSEEQLRVGTVSQERGRVRLRKYVVTENVQTTVPVSHEEVRIEREPINEANRGAAMSGSDLSEEEHEVVLNEERPVVEKEVVPQERVRLAKETVTGEEQVTEQVRKEQIDTQGGEEAARRAG